MGNKIKDAAFSMAHAKDKIIVDCINDLIKRDVLVFYDLQIQSKYDAETQSLTFNGGCLLRESDRILNLEAKLCKLTEIISKMKAALEFYQESATDDFDLATYSEKVTEDCGDTARRTLSSIDKTLKEMGMG